MSQCAVRRWKSKEVQDLLAGLSQQSSGSWAQSDPGDAGEGGKHGDYQLNELIDDEIARRWIDTRGVQDLPHRGRGDRIPEPRQLTLDSDGIAPGSRGAARAARRPWTDQTGPAPPAGRTGTSASDRRATTAPRDGPSHATDPAAKIQLTARNRVFERDRIGEYLTTKSHGARGLSSSQLHDLAVDERPPGPPAGPTHANGGGSR